MKYIRKFRASLFLYGKPNIKFWKEKNKVEIGKFPFLILIILLLAAALMLYTDQSLEVVSPNNGEQLQLGTTYPVTISVSFDNQKEIGFALYNGETELGFLSGSRLNETVFEWVVGAYEDSNGKKAIAPPGKYRIALFVPGESEPIDYSDDFMIIK